MIHFQDMKKERLSKEELSRIRSENGKRGAETRKRLGKCKGGRPKGWTKDPALKAIPARSLSIRQPDYEVFQKCAFAMEMPMVEFVHRVAESLKQKNAVLFSPDAPAVNL